MRPIPPCLSSQMMKKMMLIAPVCFSFAARSDESVDESSFATIIKAMQEQMAQLKDDMNKKDETIAALKAKTEHRQVQLTARGEVMQLVSEDDFKELAARVAKCEKANADQDAKLGMTMDTLTQVRKEIKDGRVGAPPALPPPPRPAARGRPRSRCRWRARGRAAAPPARGRRAQSRARPSPSGWRATA